jgi:hypothetical protein
MKHKQDIEKMIEETLNSLDGMQRAEPRAFFFTRLQQRIQNRKKSLWDGLERFIGRPAVALTSVLLLIILNVSLIITKEESPVPLNEQEEQAFAEEYSLTPTTIYEYENGNNNE